MCWECCWEVEGWGFLWGRCCIRWCIICVLWYCVGLWWFWCFVGLLVVGWISGMCFVIWWKIWWRRRWRWNGIWVWCFILVCVLLIGMCSVCFGYCVIWVLMRICREKIVCFLWWVCSLSSVRILWGILSFLRVWRIRLIIVGCMILIFFIILCIWILKWLGFGWSFFCCGSFYLCILKLSGFGGWILMCFLWIWFLRFLLWNIKVIIWFCMGMKLRFMIRRVGLGLIWGVFCFVIVNGCLICWRFGCRWVLRVLCEWKLGSCLWFCLWVVLILKLMIRVCWCIFWWMIGSDGGVKCIWRICIVCMCIGWCWWSGLRKWCSLGCLVGVVISIGGCLWYILWVVSCVVLEGRIVMLLIGVLNIWNVFLILWIIKFWSIMVFSIVCLIFIWFFFVVMRFWICWDFCILWCGSSMK